MSESRFCVFLMMLCLWAFPMLAAETVLYRCDFANGLQGWHGWTDDPNAKIDVGTIVDEGHTVLELKGRTLWMTPICGMKQPILCSKNTVIRFRVWATNKVHCDINLTNMEERAMYSVSFNLPAKTWTTVQRRLDKAYYRLQGTPDIPNDGLVGDHISQIQIATTGTRVMMDTIELVDIEEDIDEFPPEARDVSNMLNPMQIKAKLEQKLGENHSLVSYPSLQRNGFFPFAVVSRLDANAFNSKELGEDYETSCTRDLIDMKRHYINTYYDFCVGYSDLVQRIRRTEKVDMKIVSCCFSCTNMPVFPDNSFEVKVFNQVKDSPAILGWYGKDEPDFSHIETYFNIKKWFNDHDPLHPFTSAICLAAVRRSVGPFLEVIIPDIYSLRPNSPLNDSAPLLDHFNACRVSRDETGGHRVWFMTQTFSNRHPNEAREANFSSRYPTPEEIRLDMYSILAGGAHGISFFIYNDFVPFLGGIRGEKFDYTLVDPWGNGNAVYDEIADFGKRVVPVMPSILDAEYGTDLKLTYDNSQFLIGQYKNELGSYLFIVNRHLDKQQSGAVNFELPKGCEVYSLISRSKVNPSMLSLGPGYGEILAVTTPDNFQTLKSEIQSRIDKQEASIAKLRADQLKAAGFTPDNVSDAWLQAEKDLQNVQAAFGELYQKLVKPDVIVNLDSNPQFEPLFNSIRSLSKQYFNYKAAHAKGNLPPAGELNRLIQQIQALRQ